MPKKWIIIIISVMVFVSALTFVSLRFDIFGNERPNDKAWLEDIIRRKNIGENVTVDEEAVLKQEIKSEIEAKAIELEKRENLGQVHYSQEELDFIADPDYTVETEIGLFSEKKKPLIYSKEELDFIADPSKYSKEDQARLIKQIEEKSAR